VESEGEWSFVFLAGSFSHALRKVAPPGDFLVQEEHGGTVHPEPAPAPGLVEQASAILELVPGPLLYARVDGVVAGDRLLLMELELVEPELFFDAGPGSARRLARALRSRLEAIEGADSPRRTAGVYPPLPGNEERAR
jgi:hypothetical protein